MLRNSMLNVTLLLVVGIGTIAFGMVRSTAVASQDDADVAAKIADAMRAGPSSLSNDATILDYEMDEAGNFVVLRDGSNGWACLPDTPGTPSDDPMCFDQAWMEWMQAFMAGEEPG
jgi:hypothetical protein